MADIARALERRNKSGVYRVLAGNGGIAPAPRRRALIALRLEEREEISRGIVAGRSIRRIAQGLERSPSTVSREIRRTAAADAKRKAEEAEQQRLAAAKAEEAKAAADADAKRKAAEAEQQRLKEEVQRQCTAKFDFNCSSAALRLASALQPGNQLAPTGQAAQAEQQQQARAVAPTGTTGLFTIRSNTEASGDHKQPADYSRSVNSIGACEESCAQRTPCKIFSYDKSAGICYRYLRADFKPNERYDSSIRK